MMFTEMLHAFSGSSSFTTTGVGYEVTSEVVLLFCSIFAGWLALPFTSLFFAFTDPTSHKYKLSASFVDGTLSADTADDINCAASRARTEQEGCEVGDSITRVPSVAGLALLEQYGVFGATPGSWHSC